MSKLDTLRWKATHRHKKSGGFYKVLYRGLIEATLVPAVIYQDSGGVVWVRPEEEFEDGRFEEIYDET